MATPTRPNFIDLRTESQASVSRPLRSPRLHVAGEHPPELSPLDAFALQSRLLAKQLEESSKAGKRMSRLPPLTTDSPLIVQGRSEFFRSMSQEAAEFGEPPPLQQPSGLGMKPELEESLERPVSMHPQMSRIPPTPDSSFPIPSPNSLEQIRGRRLGSIDERNNDYFGARREQSPSSVDSASIAAQSMEGELVRQQSHTSQPPASSEQTMAQSPPRIVRKASSDALVPPTTFPQRSSSITSQPIEAADDEHMMASFHSHRPRKLSNSSSVLSPMIQQRSPSVASNISDLPRPAFNFSRPISRAGTPGLETPSRLETPARQASSDSQGSFFLADDSANTPVSMNSECFPDPSGEPGKNGPPASSYIYSKFNLPRGKMLQRSGSLERGQTLAAYRGEQSGISGQPPPSPPTRPTSSCSRHADDPSKSMERGKFSHDGLRPIAQASPSSSRPSTGGRSSEDTHQRGRSLTSPVLDIAGKRPFTAATSDSASTVKAARSQHSIATTMAEIPAEEHVAKAIALHNEGKLNESTYHLRHAAKQAHPTGMLLYALACRHGWGMRANQKEGVEWLRKAAECAGVEIAEDEDNVKEGKSVDVIERRTRKAQLALSIYELGVSHMNGWGIEQDKALALRCFEIAGSWGDVDALAEAGFCYAQGIGCKKNLKNSAKFYRAAEAKGMSMVGNSWIHKSKYDEVEEDDKKPSVPVPPRSKSRSRNFLGIKSKN